jgi:hypothetical protein
MSPFEFTNVLAAAAEQAAARGVEAVSSVKPDLAAGLPARGMVAWSDVLTVLDTRGEVFEAPPTWPGSDASAASRKAIARHE